ncbi:VOC family protein [Actinomyces slackii]|uniref:Glyoxalase/fosfomycin resistance/dioxygenase domain-containing protein n=1 Tax=Actinomyces slackii TaxID=52774 RepID=A0A3S4SS82_9ACTO|nr:VOC family protein [Actinomyces slackii]VEG73766.1 Uncharacterised protein [Actinomyces slackii]
MTATLRPYLNFPGTTREAMTFYHEVFGGELTVASFADLGALPADHPAADQVMHSELNGPVVVLSAADVPEGVAPVTLNRGNDVNLAIMADDEAQVRTWFDALSQGADIEMPLGVQIWGDIYGSLTDRFGTGWMFNVRQHSQGD